MVNKVSSRLADNYHVILQKLQIPTEVSIALAALGSGTRPTEASYHRPITANKESPQELLWSEKLDLKTMLEKISSNLSLSEEMKEELINAVDGSPEQLANALKELNAETIAKQALALLDQFYLMENQILHNTPTQITEIFKNQLELIERFQARMEEFSSMPKEARREVYGTLVKLKDTSERILNIDRARRISLLPLNREQTQTANRNFQDLTKKLEELKTALTLNNDEALEFQAISIDSKQAKRVHLMQIANDYIAGFKKLLGDQFPEIAKWENTIKEHPDIGAKDPSTALSNDKKIWRQQQKAFEKALQPILDEMKTILKQNGKEMKDLNMARDEILRDSSRWSTPIVRYLSLPVIRAKMKHVLNAFNPGYPSSLFRGRSAGANCIVPNAHAVTVQNPNGGLKIDYISSATPVEFFAEGKSRKEATNQQCLELMMNGALTRIGNSSSKDSPLNVQFTAVALLTPDPFTRFINKEGKINFVLGRIFKKLKPDPSIDESRILNDTIKGFTYLLNEAPIGTQYELKTKEGLSQKVTIESIKEGKRIFKLEQPDHPPRYFTFDVSLFNFGVNKTKKVLVALGSKGSFENELNREAWQILQSSAKAKIGNIQFSERLCSSRQAYLDARRNRLKENEALKKWIEAKDAEIKTLDTPEKRRAFDIQCLMEEIEDQMEFKDYLTTAAMNKNAYSLPSAVVTLATLLDHAAWTGCRSGKDRTSLQRIEVATRLGMHAVRGRFLHYSEMEEDPNTYRVREEILFNSGHHDEIARRNIGSQGLNLEGACAPYLQRRLGKGKKIVRENFETAVGGVYKTFKRKIDK